MAFLYGALNSKDLYDRRVTEIGVDAVDTAIELSVAEHNRQIDALFDLFVRRTTEFKTRFISAAATRLQPLDENGRARPIKPAGKYDVGIPIYTGGTAWSINHITREKITVGEVADITGAMLDADLRWMRDHMLAALFVDGTYNFTDPEHGTVAVYGLASGDTITYPIIAGADQEATDDHVKGTAALANATFTDIYTELTEHPSNGGQVVAFVPTASRAAVEALTSFYPVADANLRTGTGETVLVGDLDQPVPGTLFGYVEGVFVVEWAGMPANYLVATMTEGDKALALREDPEQSLRGFKRVADRDDYPWYERQYMRRAGFAAWSRIAAIVYRTDSATYAVPSGYTSPMP